MPTFQKTSVRPAKIRSGNDMSGWCDPGSLVCSRSRGRAVVGDVECGRGYEPVFSRPTAALVTVAS